LVLPHEICATGVDQKVVNERRDRQVGRRRWVRERIDLDQQDVGDLAEFCGGCAHRECMRRLPEASVLGLL